MRQQFTMATRIAAFCGVLCILGLSAPLSAQHGR